MALKLAKVQKIVYLCNIEIKIITIKNKSYDNDQVQQFRA